jgi:tetratricopeptide (TPR) repeat protein
MKALAIVLLTSVSGVASADDAQTQAVGLFTRAQARYEAGDYRPAIKLFEEAYQLVRDPVYLFNIAQSYRKLFDCVPAATYFERFLAEATDADAAQRAKVQELLGELGPCLTDRKIAAPAPEVTIVEAPPPAIVAPIRDSGKPLRIGGLALAGAGVAGLIVGTIYSAKGSDLASQLADCAAGCEWTAEREAIDRDGNRANRIATLSWIAGGVAVAGGLTLYIIGRTKNGTSERTSLITPVVAPKTAGVSARFRF